MRKLILSVLASIKKTIIFIFGREASNKLFPLKFIYNALISRFKNPNTIVEVFGNKMYLDSKDTLNLSVWGVYEPFATHIFQKEIEKGDVVLDIGAHIGYYTLIAAKLIGKDGRVFAFEPGPDNFSVLKKNVEVNGYKENVVLIPKAISNKNERVKLFLYDKGDSRSGNHRIYDIGDGRKSVEVESIRLDDYFKDYDKKVNFIKIDIEGAEGKALAGMLSLFNKNIKIKIISEFFPFGLNFCCTSSEEFLNTLIKLGFKLYDINEQKKKLEPVNIAKLLEKYPPAEKNGTNLFCVRDV